MKEPHSFSQVGVRKASNVIDNEHTGKVVAEENDANAYRSYHIYAISCHRLMEFMLPYNFF